MCYLKELNHAAGIDTSNLTVKRDFTTLKAEINKLEIILVNVSTGLNNLKTKVDHLDLHEFKTVSVDLEN